MRREREYLGVIGLDSNIFLIFKDMYFRPIDAQYFMLNVYDIIIGFPGSDYPCLAAE